ncbi:MAG: hypothetical protein M1833_001123 [Piccolia ochrophora]|nr:MAG: hypothetical protein M1833_001123 [Piccolia ochrophora]
MSRDIAVGMKPKKLHEVRNFARFVDHLASQTSQQSQRDITLVDFGSGQNYLGRTLTSAPYNRNVVALESKESNIERAKTMDVIAKVAQREQVRRDKKFYRSRKRTNAQSLSSQGDDRSTSTITELEDPLNLSKTDLRPESELLTIYPSTEGSGSLQHVQHIIDDGDLSYVDARLSSSSSRNDPTSSAALGRPPKRDLMVISLHSCGNLVHHGLRSLFLNPSVVAVALVGCCYNLMTERFGPQTYKFPALRSHHARLKREACRCDPHGFPMSKRLATDQQSQAHGVSLNITARSMAVQAPHNWTEDVCRGFFTRHFYRALLQRIFLDRGLIRASVNNNDDDNNLSETDNADAKASKENQPIIIGSLRKAAYASFTTYVHGAIAKLSKDPNLQPRIEKHLSDLTDEEIANYEHIYREHKKNLSIIWSLMAFSAEVAEALIVVDRWLFLKEHGDVVQDCWVEPVFDYSQSPRNLVVVGVKRQQREKDLS